MLTGVIEDIDKRHKRRFGARMASRARKQAPEDDSRAERRTLGSLLRRTYLRPGRGFRQRVLDGLVHKESVIMVPRHIDIEKVPANAGRCPACGMASQARDYKETRGQRGRALERDFWSERAKGVSASSTCRLRLVNRALARERKGGRCASSVTRDDDGELRVQNAPADVARVLTGHFDHWMGGGGRTV